MININHLRVFYHVAKNLSYTIAARELFITQPGVSHQVKSLEDHLELKLFAKKGIRIFLTDEGKTVFKYAKNIFDNEKALEDAVDDLKTLKQGALRIATPHAKISFMDFLIDQFHAAHPNINLQIIEGTSESIIDSLLENEAELGIISRVKEHPDVTYVPVTAHNIIFLVGSNHPLAKEKSVTLDQITKIPVITRAAGSGSRKAILSLFDKQGKRLNIMLETNNLDFTIQQVMSGRAGAFLVERDVIKDIEMGRLIAVPLKGHQIRMDVCIVFLKNQSFSTPAKTLLKMLANLESDTEYFPKLIPGWFNKIPEINAED